MRYIIDSLFLETTRRCNIKCDFCMRGDAQNLDLTTELIDEMFDKLRNCDIKTLVFTGGEPSLTPELIVYTINKIINEHLRVGVVEMITNGQAFSIDIARAFEEYNLNYLRSLGVTVRAHSRVHHGIIAFSKDTHHEPMKDEIGKLYALSAPHTAIKEHIVPEDKVLKTGRSTYGKKFTYKLKSLPYIVDPMGTWVQVQSSFYLSANGLVNNCPDGSYNDMDKINFGSVYDFDLEKLLCSQGFPEGFSEDLNNVLGKSRIMTQNTNQ